MVKLAELTGRRYEIEDGIPIPEGRSNKTAIYETAKCLKVGQSFVIPKERGPICSNLARATGFRFTQKTTGDQMRIWRIE